MRAATASRPFPPRAGLAPSPPAEKRGHRRDGRRRTTTEKVGGAAAVAIERLDRDARGIGRARARRPHPCRVYTNPRPREAYDSVGCRGLV